MPALDNDPVTAQEDHNGTILTVYQKKSLWFASKCGATCLPGAADPRRLKFPAHRSPHLCSSVRPNRPGHVNSDNFKTGLGKVRSAIAHRR